MPATPNILMIVTDQERFDVLGCNGSSVCETPVLDELALRGVRFENAFTPTALCSPARGSLFTGLYPHAHGVLNNTHDSPAIAHELDKTHATTASLLKEVGYRLGYVGKWHLGRELGPDQHGFDDDRAIRYDVALAEVDRPLQNPHRVHVGRESMTIAGVDPASAPNTDTALNTDAAIELLKTYASIDEPFMLRVDYEGPHHPYMPPEPFASLYDPTTITPWHNFVDDDPNKPAAHHRLFSQRGSVGMTWEQWQPIIALYYGFVTFIDSEIGRLLSAVADLGLDGETVVIHTSDHGDMTGSHGGHFNKGPIMYEELYHVPLIIADPRSDQNGATSSALVSTIDLMPTVVELGGTEVPDCHGTSLTQFLTEPDVDDPSRDAIFAEYHGEEWGLYSQRMVRTATKKYVYSPHGTDELYDLTNDPHELRNVIDRPEAQGTLFALQSRLVLWMLETDDPLYGWARRVLPETERVRP